MDDNKISHVDENIVTQTIDDIDAKFGKMSVTHRNEYVFLGMNITFNKNSTVTIMMKEYLDKSIEYFGDDIVIKTTSPAQKSMFVVDRNSEKLGKAKSDSLHSITSKLLYISNRIRIDI